MSYRTRVWLMDTTNVRAGHNRTASISGNISPSINNLVFSPATQTVDPTTLGFTARVPSVTITGASSPLRLKAVLVSGSLPTGALLYYKKNNGTPTGLGVNTYTSVTFTNNDTLTLGVYMLSNGQTGSCSFILVNSLDGTQCSNTLTLTVQSAGSGGN